MPQQALREAAHKWHSSQSCFHVSFLTRKGIFRPATLVVLFFFFSVCYCHNMGMRAGGCGAERETCRICAVASCSYVTSCHCHHLGCFFSGHTCNAGYAELKPQFLFVDSSSWFAEMIRLDESVVVIFISLWLTLLVLTHTVKYRTIKSQLHNTDTRTLHTGLWWNWCLN